MTSFNLTPRTEEILKNFATINASILIEEGNVIRTVSNTKNTLAEAKVDVNFPKTFGIYELPRFLSSISLVENPVLSVDEHYIHVKNETKTLDYILSDYSNWTKPPKGGIQVEYNNSFKLTKEDLANIMKCMSVLRSPDLSFEGNGSKVSVRLLDAKNPTGDVFTMDIEETTETFKIFVKPEFFKLIPGEYNVSINNRVVKFSNDELTYWLAATA